MEEHHQQTGHEESDASIAAIVWTGAALAVAVAMVCLIVYTAFWYLADHPLSAPRPNPMAASGDQVPPAPRLEDHPAIEVHELHSEEDKILTTYGWTDKQKGVVRIPIDRAMELRLERGFSTTPSKATNKTGGKK